MDQFKPCDRVISPSGRPGRVQHPWIWNAIELPGYRLVLLDGDPRPRWIPVEQLTVGSASASSEVSASADEF